MRTIDLRRLAEEEDCTSSALELFKKRLSEIASGERFLMIVSNADSWFALRNMGGELGYRVIRYWKEGSRDFRIEAVRE